MTETAITCSPLVFTQDSMTQWRGQLIRPETLLDTANRARRMAAANFGCFIEHYPTAGSYQLKKWGSAKTAVSYTVHASLEEAQAAAITWAKRRFKRKV